VLPAYYFSNLYFKRPDLGEFGDWGTDSFWQRIDREQGRRKFAFLLKESGGGSGSPAACPQHGSASCCPLPPPPTRSEKSTLGICQGWLELTSS